LAFSFCSESGSRFSVGRQVIEEGSKLTILLGCGRIGRRSRRGGCVGHVCWSLEGVVSRQWQDSEG
jgi:hypothetical protein